VVSSLIQPAVSHDSNPSCFLSIPTFSQGEEVCHLISILSTEISTHRDRSWRPAASLATADNHTIISYDKASSVLHLCTHTLLPPQPQLLTMPRLRAVAGPSLEELVPISVNSGVPHNIVSDAFEGQMLAYIKGFTDEDGNVLESEYFHREDRKGITWSIQVQGTLSP
jgi:hypothetical protein